MSIVLSESIVNGSDARSWYFSLASLLFSVIV